MSSARRAAAITAVFAWAAVGCGTSTADIASNGAVASAPPTAGSPTVPSATAPATTVPPTTAPPTTVPPTTAPPTTVPPTPALAIDGSPMLEFSVTVSEGVDLTRDELAHFVVETLSDERSWIGRGAGFRLVDEGGDVTVIVAEPDRVDELCAPLATDGRLSCARNGWIAFNALRWFGATDDWPGDLETYRRYLVNHEVGHYIVGPDHESCPGPGQPAPVMMQQTKGLDGCRPNGWVDP